MHQEIYDEVDIDDRILLFFFFAFRELIVKDISRYINTKEGKAKFAWNPLWVGLFCCLNAPVPFQPE